VFPDATIAVHFRFLSIFDRREFNDTLLYPRGDVSRPPTGARDVSATPGAPARGPGSATGLPLLLLFHGNGGGVADYDTRGTVRAGWRRARGRRHRGYGASARHTDAAPPQKRRRPRRADAIRPSIVMVARSMVRRHTSLRPTGSGTTAVVPRAFSILPADPTTRPPHPPASRPTSSTSIRSPAAPGRFAAARPPWRTDDLIVPTEAPPPTPPWEHR
jgi:hypothetical protein